MRIMFIKDQTIVNKIFLANMPILCTKDHILYFRCSLKILCVLHHKIQRVYFIGDLIENKNL